jgi:hypothetical protein
MRDWFRAVTGASRNMREILPSDDEEPSADAPPTLHSHGSRIFWDREMFLSGAGVCPPEIDVTGLPRFLIFGPFVTLEPGLWRASFEVELCSDAAQRVFALQFGVEPDYTTLDVPRGRSGVRHIAIEHMLMAAGAVQLRFWLKKAAFHGYARFNGATVERIADAESPPS